jgi:hypothetical protein
VPVLARANWGEKGKILFGWLREQPQQDLLDLLALCFLIGEYCFKQGNEVPSTVST